MRSILAAAALMTSGAALASGPAPLLSHAPSLVSPVQACGFYAILGCFRTPAEAARWNGQIQGGYVINTTSQAYPNFRPGYFCVVAGPTGNGQAQGIAASWRRYIPDAYVKNAC